MTDYRTFITAYPTASAFERDIVDVFPDAARTIRWTTGGMTGGSCWSDSGADMPVSAEPEPEFDVLDEILGRDFPDLTYLEYRKLMRQDIEVRGSRTEYEYYGNYEEVAYKSLDLTALYRALVDILEAREKRS